MRTAARVALALANVLFWAMISLVWYNQYSAEVVSLRGPVGQEVDGLFTSIVENPPWFQGLATEASPQAGEAVGEFLQKPWLRSTVTEAATFVSAGLPPAALLLGAMITGAVSLLGVLLSNFGKGLRYFLRGPWFLVALIACTALFFSPGELDWGQLAVVALIGERVLDRSGRHRWKRDGHVLRGKLRAILFVNIPFWGLVGRFYWGQLYAGGDVWSAVVANYELFLMVLLCGFCLLMALLTPEVTRVTQGICAAIAVVAVSIVFVQEAVVFAGIRPTLLNLALIGIAGRRLLALPDQKFLR
jgi:hypothetical protein